MEFWKAHALGNDYIVVDGTGREAPSPSVIRGLCDRHRGVGGDGVLVGDLAPDAIRLRIFNPDGSEAEKSGNGLRIFGAWLDARDHVGEGTFRVELPAEGVAMRVLDRAVDGTVVLRVAMGRPSFRAGDVHYADADADAEVLGAPVEVEGAPVAIHLVSMGNPHCVVFVDDLEDGSFERIAPALQAEPAFRRGINVQLARPVSDGVVAARIQERGAGETLASGSSACAVAAVARRMGRVRGDAVEVRMPGGSVEVAFDDDGAAHLTGPAQILFRGVVPDRVVAGWEAGGGKE